MIMRYPFVSGQYACGLGLAKIESRDFMIDTGLVAGYNMFIHPSMPTFDRALFSICCASTRMPICLVRILICFLY